MQTKRSYAELYAWVMYTVLHYKGGYLALTETVRAINECVPGAVVTACEDFRFGKLVIPFEHFASLQHREREELEDFMRAQPDDTLFPNKSILNAEWITKYLAYLHTNAKGKTRRTKDVYQMVGLFMNKCLLPPESFLEW